MPDVKISVGGREFEVSCQPGEEPYLNAASRLLDIEATAVQGQFGHLPDVRMLLMAGLMLADKTAGLEDQLRDAEAAGAAARSELAALRDQPAPAPARVEVPVIPTAVLERMSELAAQAEALAQTVDDRTAI